MNLNRSLWKEPLPWFLLIGLLIFLFDGWLADRNNQKYKIQITEGQVQSLVSKWQAQMGRSPSTRELQGLMEDQVNQEILYREALKLNLEENDTIIRRRLAQKMTFLMEDTLTNLQITDEILQTYFDTHREKYRDPDRLTFVHVYYNNSEDGSLKRVNEGLVRLNSISKSSISKASVSDPNAADPNRMGDPFMLRRSYENSAKPEIARLFGSQFANSLASLSPGGQWQGPLESSYGHHLVLLKHKNESNIPELSQIRAKVLADYEAAERMRVNEENYQELRANYEVLLPE